MKKFKEFHKINEEGSPTYYDLSKSSEFLTFHQSLKTSIESFSRKAIQELNVDMGNNDDWRGYYDALSDVLSDVINNVDFENL